MNKLSKCLVFSLALLVGLLFNTPKVEAASASSRETGWAYERQQYSGEGKHHASDKLLEYYIDGNVAYCIEPNVHVGKDNYVEGTWADTGLGNDLKERVTLIAYYGATYPGHENNLKYRAATQAMIWETIMRDGFVTISKDYWSKGQIMDLTAERAEINNLIEHHYARPSFNGQFHKVQKGKSVVLTDNNNVLSQFDVSVSGADYQIDGNVLTIIPTQSGTIDVTLTKRMPYSTEYKLFVGDTIQNMIVPGTSDPVIAAVRIETFNGTVEGYKKDKETGSTPQGQATLAGAEYGIYDKNSGDLVTTVVTDENGYFKSDSILEAKDYYLQEIKPSKGYKLDSTRYDFSLKDRESASVEVYEEVVKNYISILKQYDFVDGNTTFLNAEAGIKFEIYYPNGNLFDTITTDENGYATLNIPYGIWKFHQVNTTSGYEKIYDFYVTVDYDTKKEQRYNILNNSLTSYLQVFKIDSVTGKSIALADTTFKIYDKDKKQYVTQFVGGKVYDEFKTDETGKFTTYLKLESGNYTLFEIESPKGYLLAEDGVDFTIGNDTHFTYTNNGPVITMYFNNTPIRGKIEIHKSGESLVIENNSFNYNGRKNLKDIVYTIYADEDIKTSDGQYIYYEKDEFVGIMTTDENGYAVSEALPLGKYRVQEAKTGNDYKLDETVYHIELTEVDNKTEVVYSSYNMLNILKKGSVTFTKTDFVDGEPIPDVLMELYTENNELIFRGRADKDGSITIKNLKLGRYYFMEKEAPYGYLLNEDKLWFEIKDDGEVVKSDMKDKRVTGIIKIHKDGEKYSITDSCEDPSNCFVYDIDRNLKDIHFGLYADEDIILNNIKRYSKGDLVADGYTDKDGNLLFDELYLGNYIVKELDTIENYVLDTNEYKVSLDYVDDKTPTIEKSFVLKNYLVKSDYEFTKTDLVDDTPLPDTLMELHLEDGTLIYRGYTNEDGKIVVKNMPKGKYYLLEVEAPEGYVINEEPMWFEIKDNGEVVKSNMKDEKIKSTIIIHKISSDNEKLSGVKVGIFDLDGNLLYECYTNSEGNIEIELEYGKYYYQELEALKGYELNDKKIYFEVIENKAIIETSLINIKVPITGVADHYVVAQIVGTLIIFTGIGAIVYAKKKRK